MNTKDINKMMEAYLEVVSEKSCGGKMRKEEKKECPKCEGEGCDHCDGKGYHEVEEAKKLDPVNDKENDKPFAKRKDKDIDNDGDVDGSDEYLHKKRAATDDAIDGGDKPADNGGDDEKDDKKKKTSANVKGKTAEISKIGEKTTTKEDVDALISAMEEAANPKKGATPPEGLTDKESPKSKEFMAKHTVDKKDHDEMEKIEEPKERKVKKEMKEFEVIRALLSGNPTGE
jgi:hypothetical protein